MKRYQALVGLNTPSGRFEPGDEVKGIPPKSLDWLITGGYIKELAGRPQTAADAGGDLGPGSDTGESGEGSPDAQGGD